jgi:NAD(P)-dependent dehydrogenase (short-subunit alcohol dehydrogenase family)
VSRSFFVLAADSSGEELGDVDQRTRQTLAPRFQALDVLPVPWVEPADTSNAVLFLASDEARRITGITLPVDAGATLK